MFFIKLYQFTDLVMFDTINLRLTQADLQGRVDFLSELPGLLTDVSFTEKDTGEIWARGNLGNLTIRCCRFSMSVKDGSLCRWYLGDNYQVLSRGDTERAIEQLSDSLHLPMSRAAVTRVDVGASMIVRYPVRVYFDHLGEMARYNRLQQPSGLYYQQSNRVLCFYDKVAEERKRRRATPELYEGRNVLRYEDRITSRLPKTLRAPEVKAAMLYERRFYNRLLYQWRDHYKQIQKINQTNINFQMVNTKKELYRWGLLAGIESIGGQAEMLRQIAEAQQRGDLTPKQAYDLRAAVMSACEIDGGMITESDAISELDKRVAEAVKMFS